VDGREKTLFHYGEGFHYEALPSGTRVISPPPPLPAIVDVDAAIAHALEHPLGCDPLSALLKPGMKLTIAFDDLSLPLPPMQAPDLRSRIIAKVLDLAAAAGITDIHAIAALGLHRKMTVAELNHALGRKIVKSFYPHQL
jgi:nickel-dependent lactate racemase